MIIMSSQFDSTSLLYKQSLFFTALKQATLSLEAIYFTGYVYYCLNSFARITAIQGFQAMNPCIHQPLQQIFK